jgi:hypothetical protein
MNAGNLTTVNFTDTPELRQEIKQQLKTSTLNVLFIKKDGTERLMRCTTNPDVAEYAATSSETKPRKLNEDVMPVYDCDAKSWRSFRWDSVKTITSEPVNV